MAGGSARPKRRRAAKGSLVYERARGRTVAPAAPERRRRGPSRAGVLRWSGGVLGVAAISGLFAGGQVWGPGIWSGLAPRWPGDGYGFAVSAGVLLPWASAAAVMPLRGVNWRTPERGWFTRGAISFSGTAVGAAILVVFMGAFRPKPRHRGPDCYREGAPCWVHEQNPYIWAVILGALLIGAASLYRYATKHTANSTSPEGT
ncbi:hypothetical protein GCM10023084_69410 [Streptomyces lacrimifluminis]|uniref:Uncharacterized protein n=1 Tax=Streptomyces lacrimifluminis TaxID=1500077 RepID=A0A917UI67_9ACTN|nr:hypothetical protein [Streptomyces lacrimifluminis]GGJ60322.1 hypothetical protein GCM10012282_66970 [Streptomyces lacrimifluminis]